MLKLNDYIWAKIRSGMLLGWFALFSASLLAYASTITFLKDKQLFSSLNVAAFTVRESMQAGDWTLALGHLMKLEENGPVFKIQLAQDTPKGINLTGPFGEKPFGIGSICKTIEVANGVKLNGCMMVFGVGEAITLALIILLAIGLFFIVYKILWSKMHLFIEKISDELVKMKSLGNTDNQIFTQQEEIAEIVSIREYILVLLQDAKDASKSVALSQISSQVAHDIRSPLTALDVALKDISDIPEEKRILIRNAVNRIRDIANNLLSQYRKTEIEENTCTQTTAAALLMPILEAIVSEKRIQSSNLGIKFDLHIQNDAYAAFCNVNSVECKRMISNLINNSIEAIASDGVINISLTKNIDNAIIKITDNGCGIPATVLTKLFSSNISYGKKEGHGIGLSHAHTVINSWGGNIFIESIVNHGTTASIILPIVTSPAWFKDVIRVQTGKNIVIFDDDPSIHQVWTQRFNEFIKENQVELKHFSSSQQFRNWINQEKDNLFNYMFLVDYEIIGVNESGLDLIDEFGIQKQAILVTSRHEEQQIIDRCKKMGICLLPKSISAFIPIQLTEKTTYDAVLIDDDTLVHLMWGNYANEYNKNVKLFFTPKQFFSAQEDISHDTIIYIDSNLGNGLKGEVIAKDIYELGFKKIYLTTGMPAYTFDSNPYLIGIIDKAPPWINPMMEARPE